MPVAASKPGQVVAGIPRFCEAENYSETFGFQWNAFAETQLRGPGAKLSEERFFAETGWSCESLAGLDVLEVGSGAGRFSRVILERTQATLYSVDYSSAVEANWHNNGHISPDRFHLYQASIYELPFPRRSFDRVFCFGVLQHTPDFERSIKALAEMVKPGGKLAVDFYPLKGWWTKVHAKYLLRPLTRRLPPPLLLRLIRINIGWLTALYKLLCRVGLKPLTRFLPICDVAATFPPGLSKSDLREWAILDTFDMFSPEYDNPQKVEKVRRMFLDAGLSVTFAGYVNAGGARAAVVRGERVR